MMAATVAARRLDDDTARLLETRPELSDGGTDARIRLDLGAEQLVNDTVLSGRALAIVEDRGIGVGDDVARFRIDDHQLFPRFQA